VRQLTEQQAEGHSAAGIEKLYEQLRQHVLAGPVATGGAYGLGVLINQGMQVWMEICAKEYGRRPQQGHACSGDAQVWRGLSQPVQKELTVVVATMVLKMKTEESCRPI